jgi:hypothetical protein
VLEEPKVVAGCVVKTVDGHTAASIDRLGRVKNQRAAN